MFTTSFQTWQEHLLHSNVQQQKDKNNVLQTAAVQSIVVMTLYFDIFRSIFNSRPFLGWYRNCSTSPKKKTFIEIYYNSALFGLAGIYIYIYLYFSYFQHSYWPDAILHWKHGATNESVNMHAFICTLQGTITYHTPGEVGKFIESNGKEIS